MQTQYFITQADAQDFIDRSPNLLARGAYPLLSLDRTRWCIACPYTAHDARILILATNGVWMR